MMWYQQQTLENISKNQAEYVAELRDIKGKQQELYENNDKFYNQVRQEQKEMIQEIQQIKNYQVNQTLVDSTRHKAYLEEIAAMKANYSVWAHQQTNPNLLEMSSQKIVKQIYDNIDHKRPMFRGLLKSDLQPPILHHLLHYPKILRTPLHHPKILRTLQNRLSSCNLSLSLF
ncbi:hypothetical protein PIB30_077020 [Stylosanthes scabra]|uniref:Uncharacterized protein n=1 Tax=Stylosanthes scabra TaxID=79078 RepID=A0ABU6UPB5_9FABA|nr:hypothetical protein [Stylosanthes scabra]